VFKLSPSLSELSLKGLHDALLEEGENFGGVIDEISNGQENRETPSGLG